MRDNSSASGLNLCMRSRNVRFFALNQSFASLLVQLMKCVLPLLIKSPWQDSKLRSIWVSPTDSQGIHSFFAVWYWESYATSCIHFFLCPVWFCTWPSDALTPRVWPTRARALWTRLSDKQTAIPPAAVWSGTKVCMVTWGCLHWTAEAGCWHSLTTICLLSDVSEANTSCLVSKTIHKRDCAAPNLGMMLDILCVCISVSMSAVLIVCVWCYCVR